MGSIFIFWKIGIIYFLYLAYIYLSLKDGNMDERNWKICAVLGVAPNLVSLILLFLYYEESPRLYLWDLEIEKGINSLEKIASYNNMIITEEEKRV